MEDARVDSNCTCHPPIGWKLRHSLWMLAPLIGMGAVSWVGFVYVAGRTRRRPHIVIAFFFLIVGMIAALWPSNPNMPGDNTAGGLLGLVWAGALVSALLVNPGYLRFRWRQSGRCSCGAGNPGNGPDHPLPAWPLPPFQGVANPPPLAGPPPRNQLGPRTPPPPRMGFTSDQIGKAAGRLAPISPPASAPAPLEGLRRPATPADPLGEQPEPAADKGPGRPAVSLGLSVVASPAYVRHKRLVRVSLDDVTLARAIDQLVEAPGHRMGADGMSHALGVSLGRVSGGIACMERQLNIEGYAVIRRDEGITVLDVELMKDQYLVVS